MKRMIILLSILAGAGLLTNCDNPPPTPVPAATVTRAASLTPEATQPPTATPLPTATPTSTPTSPDRISADALDVSINGATLALNQTNATLNAGSDIATNSSGTATVNFINPDGTCKLYNDSRMMTRPDASTVFNQAMGTSYCNFSGNQPKQFMAGGVVLINSQDPALRIVVSSGNQVNVAVFDGDAIVTLAEKKQPLLKNQEAQVNLTTKVLLPRTAVFTPAEVVGFSKLGIIKLPPGLFTKGKIGLVADVGGVNDKGFNQSAWEGAQKAAKDFGMDVKYAESKQAADYEKNIDQFASAKYDVIVTVGFLMGDATAAKARQYPNIKFAIVDTAYVPTKGDKNCPDTVKDCYNDGGLKNVTSLMFQEDQAGFLAGVVAGGMTKTGTVCTVSGIRIPAVTRYVTGFQNGARWSRPNVKTLNGPISSFTDPARGKEIGQSLISQGCDVLFGVAGNTGNGGLLAAREKGLMAIGIDVDQYNTTPDLRSALITSAEKNVDVAVYNYLKSVSDGSVTAGIVTGNVQNGGVGLAPFHDWNRKIPQSVKDLVNKALDGLKSGTIQTGYKP